MVRKFDNTHFVRLAMGFEIFGYYIRWMVADTQQYTEKWLTCFRLLVKDIQRIFI